MKKQGFTLIELMVVVVIIGILAAVAVPKLFGMIAKSKASEVGPAAGTYVKLQDAYVSEAGEYYGSWKVIGYTMSSTTNFEFEEQNEPSNDGTATLADPTITWQASNVAALNDCEKDGVWQLTVASNTSSGTGVAYGANVTGGAAGDCAILTPSFGKLSATAVADAD